MNTSNNDNVILNSNLPPINVQKDSPSNTLLDLQKEKYTYYSVSINDEIINENYISEEIPSHQNPVEVINHTCDHNGNNLLNTEE